jgi:hypothetical protein
MVGSSEQAGDPANRAHIELLASVGTSGNCSLSGAWEKSTEFNDVPAKSKNVLGHTRGGIELTERR